MCLNNAHDIDVQTIQVDEWHPYLFHMNLWKVDSTLLLLPNFGPYYLPMHWCFTNETHCHMWWQSKLYIFIKKLNLSCSHEAYQDSSSSDVKTFFFFNIKSVYYHTENMVTNILTKGVFLLSNMNIFDIWWVWLSA